MNAAAVQAVAKELDGRANREGRGAFKNLAAARLSRIAKCACRSVHIECAYRTLVQVLGAPKVECNVSQLVAALRRRPLLHEETSPHATF